MRRRLAAHAFTLAQAAEVLERDVEGAQELGHSAGSPARPVGEGAPKTAPEPAQEPHAAPSDVIAWRLRAEELRATAEQFVVPSAQDALRRAAANYDRLADHAEAMLATGPARSGKKTG
ncbi:MAG TPA: hypothetical protein VN668_14695 [Stellaceae bacterium]|nr:hypothetical protein [Stellaceae bacterium]